MTATSRFCTQCGAALAANARFCTQCGTPVKQAIPPQAPQQPMAMTPPPATPPVLAQSAPRAPSAAESILSITPGLQRQKGFLGMGIDNYSLIVTPARLVFAHLDNKTMQAYVQRARAEAKAEGRGLLGQMGAQLKWLGLLERDLRAATPNQILAQSAKSFFIPNGSISRVRLRRKTSSEVDSTTHIVLLIDTTTGKHKFQIPTTFSITRRELRRRLSQTLGAVVK